MITLDLDLSLSEEIVNQAADKLRSQIFNAIVELESGGTMSKPEICSLITIRVHEKLIEIVSQEIEESILANALLLRLDRILREAIIATS